jgi:hypothetical protein
MDKKDIYEHLAKIYLDASSKKKNKSKANSRFFSNPFFLGAAVFLAAIILVFIITNRNEPVFSSLSKNGVSHELALILQPDIVRINFNFDPAKEEIYSINLNKLNLSRFKALGFSVRKANYEDNIILKLEFTNAVNENSEIYLNEMPSYKWLHCRINMGAFKGISDWSRMLNLAFIIEKRNTNNKQGIVYIDNIRFLK